MKIRKFVYGAMIAFTLGACSPKGGSESKSSETGISEKEFAESQPIESGQYRAVSYDIEGQNARKGRFDGRLLVSLSPEQSGMYVYENGNRAKIDYKLVLKSPFEKGDSGVYKALDVNDLPVTLSTDSTIYVLGFDKNSHQVKISFESAPMMTGTPLEMMERISTMIKKNSK